MLRLVYAFLALPLFVLTACSSKDAGITFEVSGILRGNHSKMIYLEEVPMAGMPTVVVDSAAIGPDGKYKLKTKHGQQNVFNLRLDETVPSLGMVVNDVERISLNADLSKGNTNTHYEVQGSPASTQLQSFFENYENELQNLKQGWQTYDSLRKLKAADTTYIPIRNKYKAGIEKIRQLALNEIASADQPAVAVYLLGHYQSAAMSSKFQLQPLTMEEAGSILNQLSNKFQNYEGLDLVRRELFTQFLKQDMGGASVVWTGQIAPEIALPDVNGNEVKLSSYRGKYVLVDFWASWCGPCRHENPVVLEAYNKYKNKNFDILGVSLDHEKKDWLKAIKDDKLQWTHVSDLKGVQDVVQLYQFQGIPFNVLLNPEGVVIAEGLRGPALEAKLKEVLQ